MNELEKNLLLSIKRSDRGAFNKLFKEHFEALCRYAFLIVREETAAEEIVTEVFYRLWVKRKDLKIRASVKKYLFKSVYNLSLNYLKHLGVVKHYKDLTIVLNREKEIFAENYRTSPLAILEYDELEEMVNDVIDKLPEQCRRVLQMNRFEGMKYREIADDLDISMTTVKYHMSTALEKLKDALDEYLDH
jgi:RNA polymerase sigma-70 factor (ECF subfamily)